MIWNARIDGAIPVQNMRIDGDYIVIDNEVDNEYKYAILTDEVNVENCEGLITMVSKDGIKYGIAIAVEIDGKTFTTVDLCLMMCPDHVRDEVRKLIMPANN